MSTPEDSPAPRAPRTPLQVIAGALGAGKTTLLRRMLAGDLGRVAVLVNEFGELGVDGEVIGGRDIDMIELTGGCVCCSLAGEFEAAVDEILDRVAPELILVETTGVAEADALVLDIEENLPRVRIDAVIVLVDADACVRFPSFGYAEHSQIETADIILLNKADLVDADTLAGIRERVATINPDAVLTPTRHADLDPDLLVPAGPRTRGRARRREAPEHPDHGFETFSWRCPDSLARDCFEQAVAHWPDNVYRAKGHVLLDGELMRFNHVAGRSQLEPAPTGSRAEPLLVWIGPGIGAERERIIAELEACRG